MEDKRRGEEIGRIMRKHIKRIRNSEHTECKVTT